MKTIVHGTNLQPTEALRNYTEQRMERLESYRLEGAEAHVQMTVVGHKGLHKAEITLYGREATFRAEEVTEDMYASVDGSVSKLERAVLKFRQKRKDLHRRPAEQPFSVPKPPEGWEDASDGEPFPVIRIKHVEAKPESVQEAVLQMNILDHSFRLYTNDETNRVEVVYRRKDGGYGLITTT